VDPITIAALVMGGTTLASAGMGASSAKKAGSMQERAMAQQAAAAQADLDFRKKLAADEKAFVQPVREKVRTAALSDRPLGYDQSSGEIKKQYSDVIRNVTAGGNFNSGLAGGAGRQAMFGQAQDLTKAYDAGQLAKLNLQTQFLGMDQSTSLGLNVGGAYQNIGNMYGDNAKTFGNLAGMGSAAAANALTSGANAFGKLYGMQTPTSSTTTTKTDS